MSVLRVAIVTGASSGMGEALSRDLVRQGWKVAMADIRPNPTLLSELSPNATFHHTDVSSYTSQASLFSAVFALHGRIDALCANAGIVDRGSAYLLAHRGAAVTDIPPEPDLQCTDVDWKGVVYGTVLAVHFMRHNPPTVSASAGGGAKGVVVATASIAAVHPHPSYPEYNGAKAAVLNWVRGTASVLWAKERVRVNCVMPGIVRTSIIPKEMVEAVEECNLTPISTITSAYTRLLDDPSLTGQAIECSVDKHLFFPDPPFLNGSATKRAVTVWDPLFEMLHGEPSEVEGAIAGRSLVARAEV